MVIRLLEISAMGCDGRKIIERAEIEALAALISTAAQLAEQSSNTAATRLLQRALGVLLGSPAADRPAEESGAPVDAASPFNSP